MKLFLHSHEEPELVASSRFGSAQKITSHAVPVFSPPAFAPPPRNIPDMASASFRGRRRKSSAQNATLFPR